MQYWKKLKESGRLVQMNKMREKAIRHPLTPSPSPSQIRSHQKQVQSLLRPNLRGEGRLLLVYDQLLVDDQRLNRGDDFTAMDEFNSRHRILISLSLVFFLVLGISADPRSAFAFQEQATTAALSVTADTQKIEPPRTDLTESQWKAIEALEQKRIKAINAVAGSVISIYGTNRQGGGSGVIIDPTGIGLTNHHVIMGAGVSGFGGLADGKLYPWKLIGTDPGGDVSIIQMEGDKPFPFTHLGDSDSVRTGDWALAMGNPFVLTEDQYPTVTLGIVSGINRYQPGAGANQLVYGNCIQVDSSINPGNSGGPLFNFNSQVIGINGRGSFKERGRVNVGLGYAISSNQIKNFIPDLLATKLVEHGTLDANFSDRQGKVVCSSINRDGPIAAAGLNLGDELLEFEGHPITTANQFTNLICTLPADWPASLKIKKPDQQVVLISIRLLGLPYPKPGPPKQKGGRKDDGEQDESPDDSKEVPDEDSEDIQEEAMHKLLSSPAGEVRFADINRTYSKLIHDRWNSLDGWMRDQENSEKVILLTDKIKNRELTGQQKLYLSATGKFRIEWELDSKKTSYLFDGEKYWSWQELEKPRSLTVVEAKTLLPIVQATGIIASGRANRSPFWKLGTIDGSDKADGKVAFRMVFRDSDDDPFYYWLAWEGNDANLPAHRLLKSGADKDLKEGGVRFEDWQTQQFENPDIKQVTIPKKRVFIRGLEETELLTLENQSLEILAEGTEKLFEVADDE